MKIIQPAFLYLATAIAVPATSAGAPIACWTGVPKSIATIPNNQKIEFAIVIKDNSGNIKLAHGSAQANALGAPFIAHVESDIKDGQRIKLCGDTSISFGTNIPLNFFLEEATLSSGTVWKRGMY